MKQLENAKERSQSYHFMVCWWRSHCCFSMRCGFKFNWIDWTFNLMPIESSNHLLVSKIWDNNNYRITKICYVAFIVLSHTIIKNRKDGAEYRNVCHLKMVEDNHRVWSSLDSLRQQHMTVHSIRASAHWKIERKKKSVKGIFNKINSQIYENKKFNLSDCKNRKNESGSVHRDKSTWNNNFFPSSMTRCSVRLFANCLLLSGVRPKHKKDEGRWVDSLNRWW